MVGEMSAEGKEMTWSFWSLVVLDTLVVTLPGR
jgi:hypothetical protein